MSPRPFSALGLAYGGESQLGFAVARASKTPGTFVCRHQGTVCAAGPLDEFDGIGPLLKKYRPQEVAIEGSPLGRNRTRPPRAHIPLVLSMGGRRNFVVHPASKVRASIVPDADAPSRDYVIHTLRPMVADSYPYLASMSPWLTEWDAIAFAVHACIRRSKVSP